jgi:hypothetical protein
MTEDLITGIIADKADLKHQFIDTSALSGAGTTVALPIFLSGERETLSFSDRWITVGTRTSGTSFIFGHPWYGLFGTHAAPQNVFGDYRGAISIVRIIQPNNIYTEMFYDNQFNGTVTNGTWDTSNHRATIGANGTIQSAQIYMNSSTINSAVLVASYSGSANWFMSANSGTNWQTCYSGTQITFSTPGTDLRWKASGTAATITSLNISFA